MRLARTALCCAGLLLTGVMVSTPAAQRWPGGGGPLAPGAMVPDSRIARLERWLHAVDAHRPGFEDNSLDEIGGWTIDDLRSLWIDTDVLAQLMRRPLSGAASVQPEGQKLATRINYSSDQRKRLAVLACAAAGILETDLDCYPVVQKTHIDQATLELATHTAAALQGGERAYILRRGALLHTDLAIMQPAASSAPFVPTPPPLRPASRPAGSIAPQSFTMLMSDGVQLDLRQSGVHWEIARRLLDHVAPRDFKKPEPGLDPMVRDWYRATASWMQLVGSHDAQHLNHAREIFPADPDILFLSGCQHETFAGAPIQSAMRSAVVPSDVRFNIGSPHDELRQAEAFFRRAVEGKPDAIEAHLRHGRVLGELGRHADAALELQQAEKGASSSQMAYYADLFLGAEQEALGGREAARKWYENAAAMYPRAQSPLVALSQLARRNGDRAGALRAMSQLFALPRDRDPDDDPWWEYYIYQARDSRAQVDAVRKPFLARETQ